MKNKGRYCFALETSSVEVEIERKLSRPKFAKFWRLCWPGHITIIPDRDPSGSIDQTRQKPSQDDISQAADHTDARDDAKVTGGLRCRKRR